MNKSNYTPRNTRANKVVYLSEDKFVDLISEVAMIALHEMRNNRPLSDYASELQKRFMNGDKGVWEKYQSLDRAERVHALRNNEYQTAEWNGVEYTIDDPLPEDCHAIYYHFAGAPYPWNAYPQDGESLRDYLERRGDNIEDVTEWWIE